MDTFNYFNNQIFLDGDNVIYDSDLNETYPFNPFQSFLENTLLYENEEQLINQENIYFVPINQLNNNTQSHVLNENHLVVES